MMKTVLTVTKTRPFPVETERIVYQRRKQKAKEFSINYPILAMEQLDSFTMRICRRNKDYWAKKKYQS
ncbi:MAG: hypothetical protein AAG971_11020 [Lactobacillus crispatus]|uniref:hypothetical protein n=2 Tax=Lactobacillus crispatus TaxID=47770 RepID=UPI0030F5458D|nr:hypothetical protein [Lactobacillus crispatus]